MKNYLLEVSSITQGSHNLKMFKQQSRLNLRLNLQFSHSKSSTTGTGCGNACQCYSSQQCCTFKQKLRQILDMDTNKGLVPNIYKLYLLT